MANKKTAPKKKPVVTEKVYTAPVPEPQPEVVAPPVQEEPLQGMAATLEERPLTAQELAYQAIFSEIECQRLSDGSDAEPETVPEYILAFDELIADLKGAHSENGSHFREGPLDIIREIGAMAVRCMEKNGAPMAEMTQGMKLNLLEELADMCPDGDGMDPGMVRDVLYA